MDEQHWLIRPPEQVDWFDPFNIWIHGITPERVAGAPRWADVLPAIVEYVGSDVIVAHNAGFDTGVIRHACAVDNIPWPDMRFFCTLVLSRQAFALPSYRLPFVTDACGSPLRDHHDALADARAVVDIVRSVTARKGVDSLEGLAGRYRVRVGHMAGGLYTGSVCTLSSSGRLTRAEVNPDADPEGLLYGRVVVFTGKLMSMTRQMAWDEAVRVGGIPDKTPTKRTNVLVVGDLNPLSCAPESR